MFGSYTFYGLLCKNHVKSLQNWLKFRIFVGRKDQKIMKITIINCERDEKRYTREELSDYEQMVSLTYLPPEDTSEEAPFVSLQVIMKRLERLFPTFTIRKGTDVELGKRMIKMGYERKRNSKGSVFKVEEI